MQSNSLIKSRIPESKIETTEHFIARGGVINRYPMGETGLPERRGRNVFRQFYFASPNTSLALERRKK